MSQEASKHQDNRPKRGTPQGRRRTLGMENLAIPPVTYINPQLGLSAAQQQSSKEGMAAALCPHPTPPTKVTDSPGHYPRGAGR